MISMQNYIAIGFGEVNVSLMTSQTNYIVDWLAELESHFLGHTIVTI